MTMAAKDAPPPITIEDRRRRPYTVLDNIIFDLGLSCQEISVYAVLCRYASYNRGRAYPSIATIAHKAGVGQTKTKQVITSLERKGIIMIDRHTIGKTKRRNIYYLLDLGGLTAGEVSAAADPEPNEKNDAINGRVKKILEKMMETA